MAVDPFKHAEDEFYRLKGLLASGRITPQQFNAELKAAMVRDAQGRYWTFAGENGKWFSYQGTQWVEANPYPDLAPPPPGPSDAPMPRPADLPERVALSTSPPAPQISSTPAQISPAGSTPPKSRSGCGCFVTGCIVVIVLLALVAGGVFLAYRSGALTLNTLLNLAGLGPASVEVDNFRDDAIEVNIAPLDTSKDSTAPSGSLDLNPFDIKVFTTQSSGRYRVEFTETSGGASLDGCTLTVKGGDKYQFVALPERIVVNRVNSPSAVGSDYTIGTSSLCR